MDNIQTAEIVASKLSEYKRVVKIAVELRAILNGKQSLMLRYLDVSEHSLLRAIEDSEKDANKLYNEIGELL